MTVPTAPIPVQTAYAVPMGSVWVALYKRNMLIVRLIKNPPPTTVLQSTQLIPSLSPNRKQIPSQKGLQQQV